MLIAGPAWTAKADSPQDTGRQPLAVEAVTAAHAGELIPGVITTTPHARYLSLHAAVAAEARRLGWGSADQPAFRRLLRRAEVVLAAVSAQHAGAEPALHRRLGGKQVPHGINAVKRWKLDNNDFMIDIAAVADEYSNSLDGFYGTYSGIESVLGLVIRDTVPAPGPASAAGELAALNEIIKLASMRAKLSTKELNGLSHLCLCQVGSAPDGQNLRRAFFGSLGQSDEVTTVHRLSAGVVVAALAGQRTDDEVSLLMDRLCCFTPDLSAVLPDAGLRLHALRWRGALLRNWSVWAWRMLWAALVDPLQKPGSRAIATASFVAGLPEATVQSVLVDGLPPLTDSLGNLEPAEHMVLAAVRGRWSVLHMLQLLAIGAQRADNLDGVSRDAFLRFDQTGLGPSWVRKWLEQDADRPLPDAAASLAGEMFTRAEKVSRQKMQWTRRGLRMPTRLRTIGDQLRLEGEEGDGRASLRLETFTSVLHQLGILGVTKNGRQWMRGPHQPQAHA
ncbi:hypothetical protein ACFO1B_41460 [Dactylosporangium siamense]|uniref:Uncharacterized protein n=1 Tax=Dactylosporangium siamense TaxID=685454 RepID=A0A919UAR4_9ACTN|nr:hypothetical protein [Dactylosporangium siamense]GIG44965.1 hypothetical protein Dsi01nite_030060 [Dactylosporangium siamense]